MFSKLVKKIIPVIGLGLIMTVSLSAKADAANEIENFNFVSPDLSAWSECVDESKLDRAVSENAIFDEIKTYGIIKDREAPYECFAQNVTDKITNNATYDYSFYACLSSDYEGAPSNQRTVEFSPYITTSEGTAYYGSWSAEITGTSSKALEPGEWTYFSGSFEIACNEDPSEVVLRIIEQGTDYGQGECVLGDYYLTGVSFKKHEETKAAASSVELEDVLPLKDAVTAEMGEDTIVGAAVTLDELNRNSIQALVEKHFNAVTFGNELKPDALFGYSNNKCPGTEEVELNKKTITVPKMDFSRAEKMLKIIKEWNNENPDDQIKVRGHVLVWHSQTPEWFFHEDYDASKAYVSKEEMSVRLEWYIKTVLEHFTGEDSPYKGMFYGWDVVNEAVKDGSKKYRTDAENANEPLSNATHGSNSSWWHVYQSNEFIIEAFRYANKYAPADLDLYYNDYNDLDMLKVLGMVQLIQDVQNAPGTRIDGMGMQGHYSAGELLRSKFESSAKKFLQTGVKVMITEWDMNAGDRYDSEDPLSKATEYNRQAHRYEEVYNALKDLKAEGYDIAGFTFWGTIDKYSWLQSRSDVGGGNTTGYSQCPLLFDDDYKVKPAYWAFVEPTRINEIFNEQKEEIKKAEEAKEETAEIQKQEETKELIASETDETDADETKTKATETQDAADENADNDKLSEKDHKIAKYISIALICVVIFLISFWIERYRIKHPRKPR